MPLLRITTSARPTETEQRSLLAELSKLVAAELGKPESYVMTAIVPDVAMTFAGSPEPACFVELSSIGHFTAEKTRELSGKLCRSLEDSLKVPPSRTYISFTDAQAHLWGHDSDTFA